MLKPSRSLSLLATLRYQRVIVNLPQFFSLRQFTNKFTPTLNFHSNEVQYRHYSSHSHYKTVVQRHVILAQAFKNALKEIHEITEFITSQFKLVMRIPLDEVIARLKQNISYFDLALKAYERMEDCNFHPGLNHEVPKLSTNFHHTHVQMHNQMRHIINSLSQFLQFGKGSDKIKGTEDDLLAQLSYSIFNMYDLIESHFEKEEELLIKPKIESVFSETELSNIRSKAINYLDVKTKELIDPDDPFRFTMTRAIYMLLERIIASIVEMPEEKAIPILKEMVKKLSYDDWVLMELRVPKLATFDSLREVGKE